MRRTDASDSGGELRGAVLPPSNCSRVELIRFAESFRGYEVWGTVPRLASVARPVLQGIEAGRPSRSVLKLRSALFFVSRRQRHADDDEEPLLRQILEVLRGAEMAQDELDRVVGLSVSAAAPGVFAERRASEWELREAIRSSLIARLSALGVARIDTEHSPGVVPCWLPEDPPVRFDLSGHTADHHVSFVIEVKCSDHQTISHSLWDAAKLIGLFCGVADRGFLVGVWPEAVWARSSCALLSGRDPSI